MDKSASEQSQPGAPGTYGLGRMLEDTVAALFRAGDVFADLAGQPAPSYGIMIPNLLVFSAAVWAALLLRAAFAAPELLRLSPSTTAVGAAAGIVLAVPLSFVMAGAVHAFMLLSGGEGDYQRSYQAASMFSVLIALQALLNWFDWVWALPALLAAYLGAAAARTLHRAPPVRAGIVYCLLAAFCVSGQWWLRGQLAPWIQTARAMRTAAAAAQDFGRQVQASTTPDAGAGGTDRGAPESTGAGPEQSAAQSSLDLLRAPSLAPGGQPMAPAQAQNPQAQALQQTTVNMFAPIMAMMNNPALTKGMTPRQAKQMGPINDMLSQMQKTMAGGNKNTPQDQAAMMAQLQSVMMQFMSQMQPQSPAARKGAATPNQKAAANSGTAAPAPKAAAEAPAKSGAATSPDKDAE